MEEIDIDKITKVRTGGSFSRFCDARASDFHNGRREEDKKPFCIVFIDVDGLKMCNDEGGHDAGNRLLRRIADRLKRHFGSRVGRFHGDEFGILLEYTRKEAERMMERIQKKMDDLEKPIAFSFGVCEYAEAESMQEAIKLADERMYQQKERRRDALRIKARP